MKKLFLLLSIVCLTLVSCTKEAQTQETDFTLQVAQQPVGGTELQSVSVAFIGTIMGNVKPVVVTVEWRKETEMRAAEQSIFVETLTFTQGKSDVRASTCKVISAYPQVSFYYWAIISWMDKEGKVQSVQTNKVLCTTEKEF